MTAIALHTEQIHACETIFASEGCMQMLDKIAQQEKRIHSLEKSLLEERNAKEKERNAKESILADLEHLLSQLRFFQANKDFGNCPHMAYL